MTSCTTGVIGIRYIDRMSPAPWQVHEHRLRRLSARGIFLPPWRLAGPVVVISRHTLTRLLATLAHNPTRMPVTPLHILIVDDIQRAKSMIEKGPEQKVEAGRREIGRTMKMSGSQVVEMVQEAEEPRLTMIFPFDRLGLIVVAMMRGEDMMGTDLVVEGRDLIPGWWESLHVLCAWHGAWKSFGVFGAGHESDKSIRFP